MPALALDCAARTDVGRRPDNEDACFASPRLAVVADGVGGAAAGEVASRTIVNAVISLDKRWLAGPLDRELAGTVHQGNETIGFIASCRPALAGMSTTLTAVALADDGTYVVANVGDSRTYLLRDGTLTALTRDESLVQELVDRGDISAEDARRHPQRSLVLRALDGGTDRAPRMSTVPAQPGDRLLLCSDGLTDSVADGAIAEVLAGSEARYAADALVDLALAAGAHDNVTVIVADVVPRRDNRAAWRR